MVSRFKQLLEYLEVTPSQFADKIGVQRSSVSHILSGRNKPSVDFLEKILLAYPEINAGWLIAGMGDWMSTNDGSSPVMGRGAGTRQDTAQAAELGTPDHDHSLKDIVTRTGSKTAIEKPAITGDKPVDQLIIIYKDGTFRILNQS